MESEEVECASKRGENKVRKWSKKVKESKKVERET